MIFNNHVNKIAPLHVFENFSEELDCEDVVLDIQRLKFFDLYPLSANELCLVAHLNENHSIDLEPTHSEYITSVFPWRSDKTKLVIDSTRIEQIKKLATESDNPEKKLRKTQVQQPFIPQLIYFMKRKLEQQELPIPYYISFEQLSDELNDYRTKHSPQ
jgi:hypothetical protein